jgi:uncharacterized protein YutE (UPF0331/DUF86 family)
MVNAEEIRHRLSEIKEALEFLKSSQKEIAENRDRYLLGRYFLQIMLEAVFTIGNQVIANGGFRKPGSYKDILTVLKDNNIIGEDLLIKISPFAELRNRLVHTYWKISQDELLEICKNLSPFEDYVKIIVDYISKG